MKPMEKEARDTDLLSLISRLEGLAEKATPGPWTIEDTSIVNRHDPSPTDDKWDICDVYHSDNRPFIAASDPTTIKTLCAELRQRIGREAVMLAALKRADQFITNGVELGFISLPYAGDPALETPGAVKAAIALAEQKDTTP